MKVDPPATAITMPSEVSGMRRASPRTASGDKTKSEVHGYGQNEFVPWALGAVM